MYKAPEQKGFSFKILAIQCHYLSAEMHFVLPFSLGTPLFMNWEIKSQVHELLGSLLLHNQVPGLPWALCKAPNSCILQLHHHMHPLPHQYELERMNWWWEMEGFCSFYNMLFPEQESSTTVGLREEESQKGQRGFSSSTLKSNPTLSKGCPS